MDKLFVNFDVLNSPAKVFYSITLTLVISLSYFALNYFVYPLVLAGTVSTLLYVFYNAVVAAAWVAVIKLANKYWIQDQLVNSGEYGNVGS